jgi:hypothetical protein
VGKPAFLKYITTNHRKSFAGYRDDNKKLKIMAYQRASEVIRVIDGRCRDHGELADIIMLEGAWRAIAEGLAVAKGSDIDFYSVTDYVNQRTETDALLENEETILRKIKEVCEIIDKKPTKYRLTSGEIIGRQVKLTAAERKQYRAFTMIAIDQTRAELKAARKINNRLISRHCMAKKRKAEGATMRCDSLARTKPWEKLGISRRTWERRGRPSTEPTAEIIQLHPNKT